MTETSSAVQASPGLRSTLATAIADELSDWQDTAHDARLTDALVDRLFDAVHTTVVLEVNALCDGITADELRRLAKPGHLYGADVLLRRADELDPR